MTHWKALLATGIALACVAVYLRLPKRHHDFHAYRVILVNQTWEYRQETGEYPKTARELVEKVGPRMLSENGLKLSFLHDDIVLVEGGKLKIEVEYYYVSPDTTPMPIWREH